MLQWYISEILGVLWRLGGGATCKKSLPLDGAHKQSSHKC